MAKKGLFLGFHGPSGVTSFLEPTWRLQNPLPPWGSCLVFGVGLNSGRRAERADGHRMPRGVPVRKFWAHGHVENRGLNRSKLLKR